MQDNDFSDFLPFQMRRFLALWDAAETAELQDAGLSSLQFWTLLAVVRSGQMTVSEIAGLLRVDQTTTSRTVDALVRRQLLDRSISRTDLRQRVITARPEGAALAADCWARLQARLAGIEGVLTPALRERGLKMIRRLAEGDWPDAPPRP